MQEIAQIISTIGFPIFSFLIAAYFIKYTYDKTAEANKNAMDKIGSLADAVNNNTTVLLNLTEEIRDIKKGEE